jgi:16S rRNA (cytosine1402-N4)-methyltransferase
MKKEEVYHRPVLVKEVLNWLKVGRGKVFVDGTLGLGGHSLAILEASSPDGKLYAFEWNEDSFKIASQKLKPYSNRIRLFLANFTQISEILKKEGVLAEGVLLDLGLSSFLIEGSGRGFTFQKDEPLDMRMSYFATSLTAKDILNTYPYEKLVMVFKRGEVPKAEKFAKFILEKRKKEKFETTFQLVSAVEEFYKIKKIDLLAVVFQSLRIEVNRELENLEEALKTIPEILKPGGRLAVISFHSLEDRIVKHFLKGEPRLKVLTKKPVVPKAEEIKENPRARSAKMRVGERI